MKQTLVNLKNNYVISYNKYDNKYRISIGWNDVENENVYSVYNEVNINLDENLKVERVCVGSLTAVDLTVALNALGNEGLFKVDCFDVDLVEIIKESIKVINECKMEEIKLKGKSERHTIQLFFPNN